ncbi:MAG TPA: EAL domain-containing protein [Caulobacterales bacterium]|nr:EAL domain-containing protein [Caulobacterales bacterium]
MIAARFRSLQQNSDLRRLTLLIGAALAAFGLALVVVVAYAGWSADRTAVIRERQLVENALDNGVSRVLDEQKSIAWWDDAVLNLTRGQVNTAWADVEYGAFLNETYHHADIFVLSDRDAPVYAYVEGQRLEPASAYAPFAAVVGKVVEEARAGAGDLRPRAHVFEAGRARYREQLGGVDPLWSAHILSLYGEPVVVSVMSIVPNVTPSLLHGEPFLLVSVVRIDEAFLGDLGGALLLPNLRVAAGAGAGDAGALTSEVFSADDGASLGYLQWTSRQPGKPLLMFILPLVALGVVLAGALTWVMIGRLKRASNQLAAREAQARHESLHDALCALPNRRQFAELLQVELDALVMNRNGRRVVVACIDVDRFKDVNDTMGHQAGDMLVKAVAARLAPRLEASDVLARFGGDEFAVMRAPAKAKDAAALAETLQRALAEPFELLGQSIAITASIGVAEAPEHGFSSEELIRAADIALYQAKGQGRARSMFFCAEMAADVEHRREIELHLRDAIERGALDLHYQPLIACADGAVTSVEALLRWRHPQRGEIAPSLFVPIAEEAGLMPALGAWVIERAFMDAARWPGLEIAINLSPVQFRHVDLSDTLQRLAAKHNVQPWRILFEVTEGVLLESTERNRSVLDAIRSMGFKVALDDFGTGYSSLRYLADFRFDKIKIDRAFVTDVNERKRAFTIIQSVVTLGRGLNMDIVAEGVETEAEAQAMRMLGVTQLQGFYFSRPVPAERVAEVVAAFSAVARAGEARPLAPQSRAG